MLAPICTAPPNNRSTVCYRRRREDFICRSFSHSVPEITTGIVTLMKLAALAWLEGYSSHVFFQIKKDVINHLTQIFSIMNKHGTPIWQAGKMLRPEEVVSQLVRQADVTRVPQSDDSSKLVLPPRCAESPRKKGIRSPPNRE